MTRRLLDEGEIRELIALIRDLFAHQETNRASNPLAKLIQFPKVPSSLSESLAVHLINAGVLMGQLSDGVRAYLSPSGGDVVLSQPTGTDLRIEVKGTAESGFQHLSSKDVDAHVILWFHYGRCFRDGGSCVDVYLLINPSRFVPAPGRITLRRLAQLAGSDLTVRRIDLRTLRPPPESEA